MLGQDSRYTYFVGCQGFVKIGKATDVKNRLSSLQTSNPNTLTLLVAFDAKKHSRFEEKKLHQKFAKYRHSLEWFVLSDEIQGFLSKYSALKVGISLEKGVPTAKQTHKRKRQVHFLCRKREIQCRWSVTEKALSYLPNCCYLLPSEKYYFLRVPDVMKLLCIDRDKLFEMVNDKGYLGKPPHRQVIYANRVYELMELQNGKNTTRS